MTVYVGEITEIVAVSTIELTPGVQTPLTDDDVTATVTLWSHGTPADGDTPEVPAAVILDEVEMTYQPETSSWRAPWDTAGLSAGKYRARYSFHGPGGGLSFDYKDYTLRAPKDLT